ncbi:GNAT family N-acetyltransferase [Paenibacillus sp. BC26]|uniref:GNAT family N-acetyltransferase n=1 Tax=Paenibacillus sp. BC26 TaxID=1881032 RepID=UPI0008E9D6C6|nr:GNAT family N-acetyltransferase [Paenibacillus sp. BC26]SFT20039.1 Acetyltransferase (GNAT) domain-containing protein [Paenibacillus sp. BC26]
MKPKWAVVLMSRLIKHAELHEAGIVLLTIREAFQEFEGKLIPQSGALRETEASIRGEIAEGGGAVIVWDGAEPIGAAVYSFKDSYLYIGRVSVKPAWRGKGIGREIMAYLEGFAVDSGCSETEVGVRLSIPGNVNFYAGMQYEVREHLFYPEGTDSWYVMRKRIV